MQITVRPRVVRKPWEPRPVGPGYCVGREGWVDPDPAVLARYQRVWPERYVVWSAKHQLFEVRQVNPVTGRDERLELIFAYDTPPKPDGALHSAAELEQMMSQGSPALVRVFADFDHEFVDDRLRAYRAYTANPQRYGIEIAKRNSARLRARIRDVARESAAGWAEIGRWVPYLYERQQGKSAAEAKTEVAPQLPVGIDLKTPAQPAGGA